MKENRFNLIDEPWIPIVDFGRASLRDVFSPNQFQSLGGNPVQKIAIFKLLLAIAQAAATPKDEEEWRTLDSEGLAVKCMDYLEKWHDRFYLYGDKPFLQMPAISKARALSFGAFLPEVSTGNTTVLIQSQIERELDEADRALLLLIQMGFALSGKKTDNSVILTAGYAAKRNDRGRPTTGKPGPAVGHMGFLHSFVLGSSLLRTIWLNVYSLEKITLLNLFPKSVGQAPWEEMPQGEDCEVARSLKESYMGRLLPLCRFCLLNEEAMHYSEGILHPGYKEGVYDLSIAVNHSGKEPKALWADTEKRPWRELASLLSFISATGSHGFQCQQLLLGIEHMQHSDSEFYIWSGGLRVSSNAGEQYVSGSDDAVESTVGLHREVLNKTWFSQLEHEMNALDDLARALYARVSGYYKDQLVEGAKTAAQAANLFWQLCERNFQELVDNCEFTEEQNLARQKLRKTFASYQHQAFDTFCPNETARQIDAWAKNRPNHFKYIHQEA
jgi:CRISPR system Cascade subunit CasA